MTRNKSILAVCFVLFLTVGMVALTLTFPAATYAYPALGLTPAPEPPAPDDNDDGDNGQDTPDEDNSDSSDSDNQDDDDDDDGSTPTDIIDIRLDLCDQPAGSELPEVLIQVKLVHQGSGWIAEGELSSQKATRFVVPYPGRWDVYLTTPPKFNTAELVDISGLNLAQLHLDTAQAPLALGVVEANATQTQAVDCPVERISTDEPGLPTAPPAAEETPAYLPTTGQAGPTSSVTASILVLANIILATLMILWGYRSVSTGRT